VEGELIEMPPESDLNNRIALYLLSIFLRVVPIEFIRHKDTELVVSGGRARLPDLMILTEELVTALQEQTRGTITTDMPPPQLIVEVVSPGKVNRDRDYRYKRSEYAARGVNEYWIVDPIDEQVVLLVLVDGLYEETIYRGTDKIQSIAFSGLELTVEQILQVKR
jgi:Uma2 family endonuclease